MKPLPALTLPGEKQPRFHDTSYTCPACRSTLGKETVTTGRCPNCGSLVNDQTSSNRRPTQYAPNAPKPKVNPDQNVRLQSVLFDSRTQTFHAASLSEYENEYEQRERRRREYPNFPDTSKVEGYKSREFKQLIEPQSSQTPLRDDKNDRHDEIAEIAKSLAIDG